MNIEAFKNKYNLQEKLGSGTYGSVYLATTKTKSEQKVAVKFFNQLNDKKMKYVEIDYTSMREAAILKSLDHPNIVKLKEIIFNQKGFAMIFEYCPLNLRQFIKRNPSIKDSELKSLSRQIISGMNYLHSSCILHRDLKTQNIFLTSKGEVKMGDFGISRVLQHTYDCAKTAIGTPYYLSPEICQDKPYNQRSDIWSLGCMLYEMVTLNHAFDATSMKGLVMKILRGNYPAISKTYSKDLSDLISRLLKNNPQERPTINQILQTPFLAVSLFEIENTSFCNR